MTAMFELPGVKRADVRVTLSVCPFSRVRQVSVAGTARPSAPFASHPHPQAQTHTQAHIPASHAVRERKFGEFFRTLAVPPETRVRPYSPFLLGSQWSVVRRGS